MCLARGGEPSVGGKEKGNEGKERREEWDERRDNKKEERGNGDAKAAAEGRESTFFPRDSPLG